MASAPLIYWLRVGPWRIRLARFDLQFSEYFTWYSWRSFRFGKNGSWSVSVHDA